MRNFSLTLSENMTLLLQLYKKRYELKDLPGNVWAVISNVRCKDLGGIYKSDILTVYDYFSLGMWIGEPTAQGACNRFCLQYQQYEFLLVGDECYYTCNYVQTPVFGSLTDPYISIH